MLQFRFIILYWRLFNDSVGSKNLKAVTRRWPRADQSSLKTSSISRSIVNSRASCHRNNKYQCIFFVYYFSTVQRKGLMLACPSFSVHSKLACRISLWIFSRSDISVGQFQLHLSFPVSLSTYTKANHHEVCLLADENRPQDNFRKEKKWSRGKFTYIRKHFHEEEITDIWMLYSGEWWPTVSCHSCRFFFNQ